MRKFFSIISLIIFCGSILFCLGVTVVCHINGHSPMKNFISNLKEWEFSDIFKGSLSASYENGENILPINNIAANKDLIYSKITLDDNGKRIVNDIEVNNYNDISASLLSYLKPTKEGDGYYVNGGFGFSIKFNNISEKNNNTCLEQHKEVERSTKCDLLYFYNQFNINNQTVYSFINLDHTRVTVYKYDEDMNENTIIEFSNTELWQSIANNDFSFMLIENNGYLLGEKGDIYIRIILSQVYYFSKTQTIIEDYSSRCSVIRANSGEYENNILLCEKNLDETYFSQVNLLNLEISQFYISRETKIKIPDVLKIGFKYPKTYYFSNMEYKIYYFDISKNEYILVSSGKNQYYEQNVEINTNDFLSGKYRITVKSKYSSAPMSEQKESIENYDYYFMIGDDADVIQ